MKRSSCTSIHWIFNKQVKLPNRLQLKKQIIHLAKDYGKEVGEINYIFCSDDEIISINRQYLQHDYYTDIITFQLNDPDSSTLQADIFVSIDTVRSNSKKYQEDFNRELHRVIFHGILHLCGLKDKKQSDIKQMRAAEDHYLKNYFNE